MIKLNNAISDIINIKDEQELRNFLIVVKLAVEELASKAKSQQIEIRSDAPDVNSVEEGEDVRYVNGVTIRTYTKINGTVRYHAET